MQTPLSSPMIYQGKKLTTVEDASVFILNLSQEKLEAAHWRAAHSAFGCALMEPAYLSAALIALKLAMTLDALVDPSASKCIDGPIA
jgi:hypothetical protein